MKACYIEDVHKISNVLRKLNLCNSEREFSIKILQRNPTYMSAKRSSRCNAGIPALTSLLSFINKHRNSSSANDTIKRILAEQYNITSEIIRCQLQNRVSLSDGAVLFLPN